MILKFIQENIGTADNDRYRVMIKVSLKLAKKIIVIISIIITYFEISARTTKVFINIYGEVYHSIKN